MIRAAALVAAIAVAGAGLPAAGPYGSAALAAGKPAHAEQKGGKPEQAGKPAQRGAPDERGADDRGRSGRGDGAGDTARDVVIGAAAAALIADYFAGELPAGYARPDPLPPGIARNLARGKPLPPGIAKKRLPQPLLARLPRPEGHRYYAVGRDVVLVTAAGIVIDILADAL